MDSTLTIQLFLFGCALTVALEAYKATGLARWPLWAFTSLFVLAGLGWSRLSAALPIMTGAIITLAASPTSWFVLAVALFFVVRPYWTKSPARADGLQSGGATDLSEICGEFRKVEGRLGLVDAKQKAIIEDYQRMSGLEARFEDALDGLKLAVQAHEKKTSDHLLIADRAHRELADIVSSDRQRIYDALLAVFDREMLHKLAVRIETAAEALRARLANGNVLTADQWSDWLTSQLAWRAELLEWAQIAERYAPGILDAIESITPDFAKGAWTVSANQIPVDGGQTTFQIFCVQDRKWRDAERTIADKVRKVAFEGAD